MPMTFITLYTDKMDVIDELDDEAAGRLLKALLHHAAGDDVYPVGEERLVYKMMVKAIDQHAERYAELCDKRRKAANTRWNSIQVNANASTSIHMDTSALEDKDQDKDEDKDKDQDK